MSGDPADRRGRSRVLAVVGTRPEAIKMAPVLRALRVHESRIETRLALTGQHDELVDEALRTFELTPDWDLALMREGQSLFDVATGCLSGLQAILEEWPPNLLLIQGDTASVFFGALGAFFEGVAVGHVEAGLRSGDLRRPFPEEAFRHLTGVLADLHFAPTAEARDNLLSEGVPAERIHVTGNPVVDALLAVAERELPVQSAPLAELLDAPERLVLLTAHRRESFGDPLEAIFRSVLSLVDAEEGIRVLYPVHPNPNVLGPATRLLGQHPRIHLCEPLSYPDLVRALQEAAVVLTDSGGIQEEAPTFGTPVLVLREVTERPEGVRAGVARLVGADPERIIAAARELLREPISSRRHRRESNPYGDGRAGERIATIVERFLLPAQ